MRKFIGISLLLIIATLVMSQITEFEHRNIPTAPEAMEIVDSFLICAEGQFIEVFNANGDSLISENIHDFGNYIYDIKADDNYIVVSPWAWGDTIKIYYRNSLPSLVEHQKIKGFCGFDMNDSLLITSLRDSLVIYQYSSDSISLLNQEYFGFYSSINPVMIYDTFFLPDMSIADINNPYELTDGLPHTYIIEDTIMYGMYGYNNYMAAYNISDINNVVLLDTICLLEGTLSSEATDKQNMIKLGDYLYVNFTGEQDDNHKLMIFDVSDPADINARNTISVNMFSEGRQVCNDLAVYNDRLYFGRSDRGLQVYDVNDTVFPAFDYTLGNRPLGIFRDYPSGTMMKPCLTEEKYIIADQQGIYTCDKNTVNYNDIRIDFDSIAAYCAHDSVISLVKNNGNGTETFIITDMKGDVYDSFNFSTSSTPLDNIIMIDDYIYFKHNNNEFDYECAVYKRDLLNSLSLIDSFDMKISYTEESELIENRLILSNYNTMVLWDIKDRSTPVFLDSIDTSGISSTWDGYLANCKNMVFIMDDNGGITCYDIKNDSFNFLWKRTGYSFHEYTIIEYCNGYIVQFPNPSYIIRQANLFTFDETGILDSVISYDFNMAFGEAVVESNYIYFPEIGAGYNRVRVGSKKQECIVPDSIHIGSILEGDSLIYTIPVFNNGDSTLVIDSIITSGNTVVNNSLPVSVMPRDTLDMEFITYEYASQMSEYVQFYTNDMYDIYNETIITAEQISGIENKIHQSKQKREYITISNSAVKMGILHKTAVQCRVFDVTGRMVHNDISIKQAGAHTINMGELLRPGVYFVDVEAGEMTKRGKMIIVD